MMALVYNNWMSLNDNPELDLLRIISRIVRRETYQLSSVDNDRIDKMKEKPFNIIGYKYI